MNIKISEYTQGKIHYMNYINHNMVIHRATFLNPLTTSTLDA